MEVWFRWFSFSNRWFSGSMWVFLECTHFSRRLFSRRDTICDRDNEYGMASWRVTIHLCFCLEDNDWPNATGSFFGIQPSVNLVAKIVHLHRCWYMGCSLTFWLVPFPLHDRCSTLILRYSESRRSIKISPEYFDYHSNIINISRKNIPCSALQKFMFQS